MTGHRRTRGAAPPEYVNRGGEQEAMPPTLMKDSQLVCFVLHSDMHAQNEILDRTLNRPSGRVVEYRAILPYAILYFADFRSASSADFSQIGLGSEQECEVGFWQPAVDMRSGHLAWYPSYIFTSTTTTVVTGREVYGFPKQWGEITGPSWDDPSERPLEVRTPAVRRYGFRATPELLPVVRARRTDGDGPYFDPTYGSVGEAVAGIVERLPSREARAQRGHPPGSIPFAPPVLGTGRVTGIGRHRRGGAPRLVPLDERVAAPGMIRKSLVFEIGAALLEQHTDLVFLKQFRDAQHPHLACYQAIVQGSFRVEGFRSAGFLRGSWEIEMHRLASEPIIEELGLSTSRAEQVTLTPVFGFGAEMDLEFGQGRVRWRAGGDTS